MSTNWLPCEDLQLCISYCRNSVNSITGNKQKVDKLWQKIFADYHENYVPSNGEMRREPRSQTALSSRFTKLKPNLVVWGASLAFARRNPESGGNLVDEMRKAQTFYVAKKNKEFEHFQCWEAVKDHPTFKLNETNAPPIFHGNTQSTPSASEASPTINLEESQPTPESHFASSCSSPVRPIGVKAAKEAKRRGKGKQAMPIIDEVRNETLKTIAANQKNFQDWQKESEANFQDWQKESYAKQLSQEDSSYQLRKLEEETKIMTMNLAALTPNSRRYFAKRKADILKTVGENEEDSQTTFGNCYRPLNFDD